MNSIKTFVKATKLFAKITWGVENVNEWLLSMFARRIRRKQWEELFSTIEEFFKDFTSDLDNKKDCLDYLFQNKYINLDNVEQFISLFPEFEENINNMRAFLVKWKISNTKNSTSDYINRMLDRRYYGNRN